MNGRMSAIGPKRTSLVAPHMSAFGGKADMTLTGLYVRLWPMAAKRLILRALSFPVFQCFTILSPGVLAANAMRGRSSVDEKRELLLQRVTADSEIVGSTV
jgi:hypothetical protein